MPLSEREEQILTEIEKHLHQEDPDLARRASRRGPRFGHDALRMGALAAVVGFISLIAFFFTQALVLGVVAFGAMVAGIVLIAGAVTNSFTAKRSEGPSPRQRIGGLLQKWEATLRRRYRKS